MEGERWSGFSFPVSMAERSKSPRDRSSARADRGARRQRRPKALLAEGPGEYATYDIAPGKATLGHHVAWMLAPQEALDAVDHLGPICEPK